jgi:hypothetical protein
MTESYPAGGCVHFSNTASHDYDTYFSECGVPIVELDSVAHDNVVQEDGLVGRCTRILDIVVGLEVLSHEHVSS